MKTDRDALCEKYFPQKWAGIKDAVGKSKARNNLRKAAGYAAKNDKLRAAGASCANCSSFNATGACGSYCDRDTDFYGYALTKPDDLCAKWSAKK
jgi:hypothetical protein